MSVPTVDIQSLDPGATWDGFILDCTPIGGLVYRFHCGANGLGQPVVWQGNTYQPWPVEVEGLEQSSKGTLPRPTVRAANLDSTISVLLGPGEDLLGAKVIRKRTLVKYLDAVNFPGGANPTADDTAAWDDDTFFIEQKTSETNTVIEWQLVSSLDCQGLKLPRRIIQATVCTWADASICPYSVGGQCAKTLAACKTKWGASADLPFGGFPASSRIR